MKVKLWLDDIRVPVDGWTWVKTAEEAIALLKEGACEAVSLDHDLGTESTGYTVACWIEEAATNRTLSKLMWTVHSANPVGRDKMRAALFNADQAWNEE